MTIQRNATNCLVIVLEARGAENALGFSLCFDTNQLSFVSARRGIASATAALNINSNQAGAGRLGCAMALPTGEQFPAGNNPVLEVCFRATAGAGVMTTPVTLCDTPLAREIVDASARSLTAFYSNATVTLVGACTYALATDTAAFNHTGGTAAVGLVADAGCSWNVVNTNSWIAIQPLQGVGATNVSYTVASNVVQTARNGVVVIAGRPFTVVQAGMPCTYTLQPSSRTHPPSVSTGQVSVLANSLCGWFVRNSNSWIAITSPTNGTGNGTVNYSVAVNPGFVARTGVVSIADQAYTVIQSPPSCTYSLSPTGRTHTALSEFATVNVSAPAGCDWEIVNTNDWILIKLATNGTGDGLARYTVQANNRALVRSGVITIAGRPYWVTQLPAPCSFSMLQTNRLFDGGGETGVVVVATLEDCTWTAVNTNIWIEMPPVTGFVGGGRVGFAVGPNFSNNERVGIITAGGMSYTITQLPADATSTLTPPLRSVGYELSTGSVTVAIGTAGSNDVWRVYNTNSWISIPTGYIGTGRRVVPYTVLPLLQHIMRTGMVYIADRPFTIIQSGPPCLYTFSPTNRVHEYLAETSSVPMSTDGECGWGARSDSPWLVLDSATNGFGPGLLAYHVTLNAGPARTGRLLVSNQTFTVTQNAATPVSFTRQPTNQFIVVGQPASFVAAVTGTPPLTCQWQVNGTNLVDGPNVVGATSTNLSLSNVQPWQSGNYSLIVSNIRGSVTSAPPAVLRVNTPPTLPVLADRCVVRGTVVSFSAAAVDTDVPVQKLTYSLDPGAPAGASINANSGVFTWTATAGFGPNTNRITVHVVDNGVPPLTNARTFSITVAPGAITNLTLNVSPTNGAVLPAGNPLNLTLQTGDANGTVARAEFILDGKVVAGLTSPPHTFRVEEVPSGLHVVTVRALDVCGTAVTSAPNYFLIAPPGAQVLLCPGFTNPPLNLALAGSATVMSNELFLTRAISNQTGSVWYGRKALLTEGFQASFVFRASVPAGNPGGEGFAFVAQNSAPAPLESGGANLGYAGISNSLAIEFDSLLSASLDDPDDSHISIHTLGLQTNSASESASIARAAAVDFSDGLVHAARIDYLAGRLRVFLDDFTEPLVTVATNLSSILDLENGRAWVGFTSATAAGMESHEILAWSLITTNLRPLVALSRPTNGSTFISPAVIPLVADATDLDDRVVNVDFFLGSNLLGSSTGPVFGMQWTNVPPGDYTFTARAVDSFGLISTSAPSRVVVVFVNKPPSFTPGPDQSVLEDSGPRTVPGWASAVSAGPPDEAWETVSFVVTNDNAALFSAQPRIDPAGTLSFTPAPDAFGSAVVTVLLKDDGGTANGGRDTSAARTFVIQVVPVNDPPSFVKGPDQTVLEDAGPQSVSAWAAQLRTGPTNEASQLLNFVVTTDNPSLFSVQPAVTPNGTLNYTTAANSNGVATVRVVLKDDGGTDYGGTNSSGQQTFTITVVPVNDPPGFTPGPDVTVLEDSGPKAVTNWATNLSPGPPNEASQGLTFVVTNDFPVLFASQPAIDAQGTLTFLSAPDAFGVAVVSVVLRDTGGTANGGGNSSAPRTFLIRVGAVNDPPSFKKGLNQFVRDNAEPQTIPAWATLVRPGPLNESNQLVSFDLTTDNPGLFDVLPLLTPTGTLTYTPKQNLFGIANVQVILRDNGGTADGGRDTSAAQEFRISIVTNLPPLVTLLSPTNDETFVSPATLVLTATATDLDGSISRVDFSDGTNVLATLTNPPYAMVLSNVPPGVYSLTACAKDNFSLSTTSEVANVQVLFVNKAPSFTPGSNQSVLEDSGSRTVPGWASAMSVGPPDEAWETLSFIVTNDTPEFFAVQPAIDPAGTLTYTPAPDAFGTSTVSVILRDNGGTANGGSDSSAPVTFSIRIVPVNDAPTGINGADPVTVEDSGTQVVPGWATQIRAGPVNESSQAITISATTDNPELFASPPVLDANGTLTYTPAADKHGVATVHVTLRDDGGTANGGRDTSVLPAFTITVLPVNDAPSFTAGPDVTVLEDAGLQAMPNWAVNLRRGPASEAGQQLTFVLSNDSPVLFAVQPSIDANGNLTFASAPDAFGVAKISVVLHDDGGTANGGVDASPAQTLTIRVVSVNDPPSFIKGPNLIVPEDAGVQILPAWATQIRPGPTNESGQTISFSVTNDNPALFQSPPSIAPDGTLSFTPAPEANGIANIQVVLRDNGGTNNGGIDKRTEAFSITVLSVNDPPSFTAGPDIGVLEDAGSQVFARWASNIRAGPANEGAQLLHFECITCDNVALFSQLPAVATDGTLRFRTAPDAVGSSRVTFVLVDDGGTLQGGRDTSSPQTMTITVSSVNDAPTFTAGTNVVVFEGMGPQVFPQWATQIRMGPSDESGQHAHFAIIANDRPSLFQGSPTISSDGTLRFRFAPDAFGTSRVTIVLIDDGGTNDGGEDTSAPATFTITALPINDPPTFIPGSNVVVLEDAGLQVLANWATDVSPGAGNESEQQVHSEVVACDNPDLFSELPSIDANGNLRFRTAPNAVGSSQVSLVLKDDGGTENGGEDTSAVQTVTFLVVPVNDAPGFDVGPDVVVLDDAGPQWISNWAGNFRTGPPDEAGQQLQIRVQSDNATLFAVPPTVDMNGTLAFEPIRDVVGRALVTVILQDDGGTENGGADAFLASFWITVRLSNRPPFADTSATATRIISPNNTNATVILDGTRSLDPDNDPLQCYWFDNGDLVPFAAGLRSTNVLSVGVHTITMLLDDGRHTVTADVVVNVLDACETVDDLIVHVESAAMDRKNRRPLVASLKASCASFERGSFGAGANQLMAFQNKLKAQVEPAHPALALQWTLMAQEIIDAVAEE